MVCNMPVYLFFALCSASCIVFNYDCVLWHMYYLLLYSVETDSTIDFRGNYVLGDRYYNNVRINQFVHAQNGTFIGTLGKGKGGPREFNAGGKAKKVARTASSASVSSSAGRSFDCFEGVSISLLGGYEPTWRWENGMYSDVEWDW